MDAKAQPSAFDRDWVVIANNRIESKWRTEQDAETWAARIRAQHKSYGGASYPVDVDSIPTVFYKLRVEKEAER